MKKGDGFVLVYSVETLSTMEELVSIRDEILRIKVSKNFQYLFSNCFFYSQVEPVILDLMIICEY